MGDRSEILLISPDEATVLEVRAALSESRFYVISEPRISSLRTILEHIRPDAVIVDTGPDPESIAIQILEIASGPSAPPMVALEGCATMPRGLRERLAPAVRILRKPILEHEIVQAVRSLESSAGPAGNADRRSRWSRP